MATRTVRMDEEQERLLARILRRTGGTASDALKRGLTLLEKELERTPQRSAWDVYSELDLGPGGSAAGPAAKSRETVQKLLDAKRKVKR
ncbi:MAG: hypothetical protein NW203_07005 [Hyphomonadaceae bacterium]|nr:hypothetical protein [Hyphomonadaceae bacterium]